MNTVYEQIYQQIMIAKRNHNHKMPDFIVLGGKTREELFATMPIEAIEATRQGPEKLCGIEIAFSDNENEMCVCYKG